MHRVVIRSNAAYKAAADGFIEVCTECEKTRCGSAATCSCGVAFAPAPKKFFILKRTIPAIVPSFPSFCPHCAGPGTRRTTVSRALHTSRNIQETVIFELPVCSSFRNPLIYYFAFLVASFLLVFACFVAMAVVLGNDPRPTALLWLLPLGAAAWWAYRGYTWIRLPSWGESMLVFSVRRESYARELAAQNRGYVRGRLRAPE